MTRRPDAEARETALTTATRSQFSTLSRAILAGDRAATKRITEALGEYVADDSAAAQLVRDTLTDAGAFQKVLTDLMWTAAGELAEAEIDAREQHLHDNYVDQRIEEAKFARHGAFA